MTWTLVAVLMGAAPPAPPVRWSALGSEARAARIELLRGLPLPERVMAASEGFLGTRYRISPLGEGAPPDADPLIRLDAVDCLTFVEQSLALASARAGEAPVEVLGELRYGALPPDWQRRNHVMEAQWLPNAVRKGFLRDVTSTWGGDRSRTVKKELDATAWSGTSGRALALDPSSRPTGSFALTIIPPASLVAKLERAPSGLVLVVVRADRPRAVTRVSHLGLLVQSRFGPRLRHASRTFRRVVDEPLAAYLERNLRFAPWTIEGVAVFEPTERPPVGRGAEPGPVDAGVEAPGRAAPSATVAPQP